MSNQEFVWWLGGVMAATPVDATVNARAEALEIVRGQLIEQLRQNDAKVNQHPSMVYPPGTRAIDDNLTRNIQHTTAAQGIR